MIRLLLSTFVLNLLFLTFSIAGTHSNCGKITFGDLDWDSSRFHVDLASFILKYGYDCEVDRIPGTTMPLLTALGKGDIDVLMEVWKSNVKDAWNKLEENGDVRDLGVNFPDAYQGFYIPTYMIKGDESRGIKAVARGLKTVEDLKKFKDLFLDPEDPTKGRFYNCAFGWSCEDVNTKKFTAYGLDKYFVNFRAGTGAALAAMISSKYERGENFIAYYWGPTWVLGKYNLTKLKEPKFDPKVWKNLVEGTVTNKAVEYPVVKVKIGVNSKWAKKNPVAVKFLQKYETQSKNINQALSFIQDKKSRTIRDATLHFLVNKKEKWAQWVSFDARNKILSKIDSLQHKDPLWKLNISKFINKKVTVFVKVYGSF